MATAVFHHSIGSAVDGSAGIGGCKKQSDNRANGQVVEVIPDEGGLLCTHPKLVLQGREGCWLVFDADEAMGDAQLPGPDLRRPLAHH